jgi:hypothetical protein
MQTQHEDRMWAGIVVLAIALLGACAAPPERQATTGTTATTTVETTVSTTTTTTWSLKRSEPTELWIPRLGARSSLVPLGLNEDGTVEVPPVARPMQAGWYTWRPRQEKWGRR